MSDRRIRVYISERLTYLEHASAMSRYLNHYMKLKEVLTEYTLFTYLDLLSKETGKTIIIKLSMPSTYMLVGSLLHVLCKYDVE